MAESHYCLPVHRTHTRLLLSHSPPFLINPPTLALLFLPSFSNHFSSYQHLITDCTTHPSPSTSFSIRLNQSFGLPHPTILSPPSAVTPFCIPTRCPYLLSLSTQSHTVSPPNLAKGLLQIFTCAFIISTIRTFIHPCST